MFGLLNEPCTVIITECIRLSGMDILTLASMKTVAKCDT
jgi:hypothetical protein